ncbi:ABC transporter ATP-binding protein [Gracilibacillus oryzae]|uniref:ABC transporter ATP-binding protein n=1 Tax=Gracilibacillus oryzae TaxID=1672701 RepID=A0A7C8L7U7_9BACI|nr:ABC transporter ATP-binding protein [Gracilibacillus oryzae]KAB8137732.1 ABC transporter ATP-binding protein [Gracilibacillus oryzae]
MNNIIEVNNVTKVFDKQVILKNVQLEVAKGKTIGIAGKNGSGKSVLFKIICGLTRADTGTVKIREEILGKHLDFPDNVGIFINAPGYIEIYNGFKNLKFLAAIKNKITDEQIKHTRSLVGLNPENKTKVKNYSLGMKQKLGLAQAIMENQDILILDEPFNGLDYKTYHDVKEVIHTLKEERKTILLTSHHYQDIEELCDEVYFISDGEFRPLTDDVKEFYFRRN